MSEIPSELSSGRSSESIFLKLDRVFSTIKSWSSIVCELNRIKEGTGARCHENSRFFRKWKAWFTNFVEIHYEKWCPWNFPLNKGIWGGGWDLGTKTFLKSASTVFYTLKEFLHSILMKHSEIMYGAISIFKTIEYSDGEVGGKGSQKTILGEFKENLCEKFIWNSAWSVGWTRFLWNLIEWLVLWRIRAV